MSLRGCPAHAGRVGLELTKAYIQKGWKVIAAVRDPKSMPKTEGWEVVVIKLDAGEKEDARKASLLSPSAIRVITVWIRGGKEWMWSCCGVSECANPV